MGINVGGEAWINQMGKAEDVSKKKNAYIEGGRKQTDGITV